MGALAAADPTQHATHTATYWFADAGAGVDVGGRAMVVPGEKLGAVVRQIADSYAVGDPRGVE